MSDDKVTFGPVEHVGTLPEKPELTVIPADERASAHEIGFTVTTLIGSEVYRMPEPLPMSSEEWGAYFADETNLVPATEDLRVGQRLLIQSLIGWCVGVVRDVEGPTVTSPDGGHGFDIERATDGRTCWICIGSVNLRAIRQLRLYREGSET